MSEGFICWEISMKGFSSQTRNSCGELGATLLREIVIERLIFGNSVLTIARIETRSQMSWLIRSSRSNWHSTHAIKLMNLWFYCLFRTMFSILRVDHTLCRLPSPKTTGSVWILSSQGKWEVLFIISCYRSTPNTCRTCVYSLNRTSLIVFIHSHLRPTFLINFKLSLFLVLHWFKQVLMSHLHSCFLSIHSQFIRMKPSSHVFCLQTLSRSLVKSASRVTTCFGT